MYLPTNHGVNLKIIEELKLYDCNNFQTDNWQKQEQFPVEDEPHLNDWQQYAMEARENGVYRTLKKYLVQLQFPIQQGISDRPEYRQVTRQGKSSQNISLASGLKLSAPDKLRLLIHQTVAGKIPVLIAGNRQDFVALVQALTRRNEPQVIPDSMGACIVGGYNNWNRIYKYRQRFYHQHPQGNWQVEFTKLKQHRELFQDRFIILSPGGYSNVTAKELGLESSKWSELSWQIRLEHECTHYLTRRLLGSMANNAFDELIADYQGIVAAGDCEASQRHRFRADWFLRFMGLKESVYQPGGRLENYLGDPPLSDAAFCALQILVTDAAHNLERFDRQYYQNRSRNEGEKLAVLIALTKSSLSSLAAPNAVDKLLFQAELARTNLSSPKSKTLLI